ncbi:MAG: hypothetical protein RPR91_07440, partial [Colwellia sp.]
MIKLSKWQFLLCKRFVHVYQEGLIINSQSYPYPSIDFTVAVNSKGPFLILKWGDKTFLFFNSKALKHAFEHLFDARIEYWRSDYFPEFEGIQKISEKFVSLLRNRNRYIKTSYLNELVDDFSENLSVFKNETAWLKLE